MSTSLNATAYSSKESKEFQRHYKAVKFCIENELSFPIETSNFFKGKLGGDSLEDIHTDAILKYIENGVEVVTSAIEYHNYEVHIKVAELPKDVDLIIIKLH